MELAERVLEALPEPLLVVEGDRVAWANPAAEALLGFEGGALHGHALADVLGAGQVERLARIHEHRRAGWPMPESYRIVLRDREGRDVPAELRLATFERDGTMLTVLSARSAVGRLRAEELLSRLTRLASSDTAVDDHDALLDASAGVFQKLGWTLAFTEVLDGASVTRKVVSAPGDPVGEYGKSIVGVTLPFSATPVVAEVVSRRKALYLDELPSDAAGPVRAATALSAAMTRGRVTRSAWCPVFSFDRVSHVLSVAGPDLDEHDFIAIQTFALQLGAAIRRAELRAELVRRERLAALGEMAAVLAHEVRNPLAVIFNALSCIRRQSPKGDAIVSDALDAAAEEAERLRRLMSDLLEFARPPTAELRPLALASEVQSAVEAVRQGPGAAPLKADVVVELPETLPAVEADPSLLRRTLVNVLENALQHAADHSAIRVHAERTQKRIRLNIDNDGEQVSAEVAERAFEPFFTTRPMGTGLGLAVVRQAMESMGGSASIEPTERGARVTLTLRSAAPPG